MAVVRAEGDSAALMAGESEIYGGRVSPSACSPLWTAQTLGAGIIHVCIPSSTSPSAPLP